MEIQPASNSVTCSDTILIRFAQQGRHSLRFGLPRTSTLSVALIDGQAVEHQAVGDSIELDDRETDTTAVIVTRYAGSPGPGSDGSRISGERAVLQEHDVFLSAPQTLRFLRLTLVVPAGWRSMAAGRLVLHDTAGGVFTDVWEAEGPLRSPGWICAGRYSHIDSVQADLDLSIDHFAEDTVESGRLLTLLGDVVRFYGSRFSPYRFPKLSLVEVDDWVGGKNILAIAAPSFIMVKRMAFTTGDRFNRVETILPHEIAHQWWPMTVFIRDEDAAFLSEGMCEYSDRLYHEARGGLTSRDSLDRHPLLASLMTRVRNGEDLPLQRKADLRSVPTEYLKAAYVHHMLRGMVGDSEFLAIYGTFARRYAGREATLEDFRQTCEEVARTSLGWFFDQWIRRPGIPRLRLYNVHSSRSGEGWLTVGRVRLIGLEKYTAVVPVVAETPRGGSAVRVRVGTDSSGLFRNDVPFSLRTDDKPDRVSLDPRGDLLSLRKLPPRFSALREPAGGTMIIGTRLHGGRLLELARSDSAEMDRAGWALRLRPDTAVSLGDLQNSRVFLYGLPSENSVVADLQKKFPLGLEGDTALLESGPIADSSLALLQIIENPFSPGGLLCWIAPLSSNASPSLLPYDASWALTRGRETIVSGVWNIVDEDQTVDIR